MFSILRCVYISKRKPAFERLAELSHRIFLWNETLKQSSLFMYYTLHVYSTIRVLNMLLGCFIFGIPNFDFVHQKVSGYCFRNIERFVCQHFFLKYNLMEKALLIDIFACLFEKRPIPNTNIYKALSFVFPPKSSIIHLNIKWDPMIKIFDINITLCMTWSSMGFRNIIVNRQEIFSTSFMHKNKLILKMFLWGYFL